MTYLNKLVIFTTLMSFISCSSEQTTVNSADSEISESVCSFEELGFTEESNIAEVYFYTGTCNYRNKNYKEAGNQWKKLAALENVDSEYKKLQINVLNNLGYLMFNGLGLNEEKNSALKYWEQAVELEHDESTYFLCSVLADPSETTYNAQKSLPFCKKAKIIYENKKIPNELDIERTDEINTYLKKMKKQ